MPNDNKSDYENFVLLAQNASENIKLLTEQAAPIVNEHIKNYFSVWSELIEKTNKFKTDLMPYLEKELAPIYAERPELKKADINPEILLFICNSSNDKQQIEELKEMLSNFGDHTNNLFFKNTDIFFPAIIKAFQVYKSTGIKKTQELEHVTINDLEAFMFAFDNVNNSIYDNKDDIDTKGLAIPLKAEPDKSKRAVTINVILCLDERIENNDAIKRLNPFDRRVYDAVSNLFYVGNTKLSTKDIYKAMGNNNNPAKDQRRRILQSIEKMSSIRITIDTSEEEKAGYNYPNLHIKRQNLLYTKTDIVVKNGKITEAVEIMEEPVLFKFAVSRNQYTTIPPQILCNPVSKTETTLAIENYLIRRISERGKNNKTILLSTVYAKAEITTGKQRHDAKKKIIALLDYWKQEKFIKDYDICMNDNKTKPEECIKIKQ